MNGEKGKKGNQTNSPPGLQDPSHLESRGAKPEQGPCLRSRLQGGFRYRSPLLSHKIYPARGDRRTGAAPHHTTPRYLRYSTTTHDRSDRGGSECVASSDFFFRLGCRPYPRPSFVFPGSFHTLRSPAEPFPPPPPLLSTRPGPAKWESQSSPSFRLPELTSSS